jgi:anaerobic ribonucleoside-triphosphate reductase
MRSIISFSPEAPQTEFLSKFAAGFKILNEKKDEFEQIKDSDVKFEEEVDMEDEELKDEQGAEKNISNTPLNNKAAEQLQNNPEYRSWIIRARAVVGILKLLENFC